jgi:biopolymer transport protein ExbB
MDIIVNTIEYFSPGGIVMIPIILTSLIMWALIIERLLYFRKAEQDNLDVKEAVEIFRDKAFNMSSKGLRVKVLDSFLQEQTGKKDIDKSILDLCVRREIPCLRRYLAVIAVLAAIAPLLGLLGTVTGMITTFNVIALFGTGNARAMAGGISEALITTQSGLLVAIPGLFMSAYLIRRADRLESRMFELIMTLKRHV